MDPEATTNILPPASDLSSPQRREETWKLRAPHKGQIRQRRQEAQRLRERLLTNELALGNLELAALLGDRSSQLVLGRFNTLSPNELIDLILYDPNITITIEVREPSSD